MPQCSQIVTRNMNTTRIEEWEKRFCFEVGRVTWKRILDTHKFQFLFSASHAVQWNDSAGQKAFRDAKKRYLSKIKGLPCKIRLPDPDMYIDKIDWDSRTDNDGFKLGDSAYLSDEDRDEEEKKEEKILTFEDLFKPLEVLQPTGWDVEVNQEPITLTGMIVGCDVVDC
ncbi:hypothetical protein ACFE04_003971 [Oxalis oulophora]